MTAPRKTPGAGTTLSITPATAFSAGTYTYGTLTPLGNVVKIKPSSPDCDEIDASNLADAWAETLLSIPDAGELEFTINYDAADAGHEALWTNFTNTNPILKAGAKWTVTFNDVLTTTATTVVMTGGVKSFPFDEIDLKKLVTVPIVVRLTGQIIITPAA